MELKVGMYLQDKYNKDVVQIMTIFSDETCMVRIIEDATQEWGPKNGGFRSIPQKLFHESGWKILSAYNTPLYKAVNQGE